MKPILRIFTVLFFSLGCETNYSGSIFLNYPLTFDIKKSINNSLLLNTADSKIVLEDNLVVEIFNKDTSDITVASYIENGISYIYFDKIFYSGSLPDIYPYIGPYLIIENAPKYFIDTIKINEKKIYNIDENLIINDSVNYMILMPKINSMTFSNLNKIKPCYIGNNIQKHELSHPFFGMAISSDSIFTICTEPLISAILIINCK